MLSLDISKNDVTIYDGKKCYTLLHEELIELVKPLNPGKVILEPTGMYSRFLSIEFQALKWNVLEINLFKFKKWRESENPDHKTDKADAIAIYEYAQKTELNQPREILSFEKELRLFFFLSEQSRRYKVFLESCKAAEEKDNCVYLEESIKELSKLKTKLQKEISQHLHNDLSEKYGVFLTAVLTYCNPARFPTSKHWASYLGFKLKTYESGKLAKKRSINKRGNRRARELLYLKVMNICRHKKQPWYDFYRRLKEQGKPGLVAIVATMRKISTHFYYDYLKATSIDIPTKSRQV